MDPNDDAILLRVLKNPCSGELGNCLRFLIDQSSNNSYGGMGLVETARG